MDKPRYACINAFWLKLLMAVLMVLDHLYYHLFPDTLLWGHIAARVVAPVFAYLMTEGLIYTRSRGRYLLRMFAFALAMQAGNTALGLLYRRPISNSIIMSLTIGAALICCIEQTRESAGWRRLPWLGALPLLVALSLFFEGAYMIPLMALIFFYLRHRPVAMWVVFFLAFSGSYLYSYSLDNELQPAFWICLAFIPILLYNGKRGPSGAFAKYFFYIFYPLHIWVIFLLEQHLLYGGL